MPGDTTACPVCYAAYDERCLVPAGAVCPQPWRAKGPKPIQPKDGIDRLLMTCIRRVRQHAHAGMVGWRSVREIGMTDNPVEKPFAYLDGVDPAPDAPVADNPSGLYCPACRAVGLSHCSSPEYCGGMKPMRKG